MAEAPNLSDKLNVPALAEFIRGALMASDTPLECFLDDGMLGPVELAQDILFWIDPDLRKIDGYDWSKRNTES